MMIQKKKSTFHTYNFNFGIVLPRKTGVLWEQQTQGVCCHHVNIEGVFIPLRQPYEKDTWDTLFHKQTEQPITQRIAQANYDFNEEEVKYLWALLKRKLQEIEGLEFEEVEAPFDQPENQEGIQWIKIIKWQEHLFPHNELVNEVVCLIYPNSD